MPNYIHEIDNGECNSTFINIEFKITYHGTSGSYLAPPEPPEFEIEYAQFVTPITEADYKNRKKGVSYITYWRGRARGTDYYEVGRELTQKEISSLDLESVIYENWDPEWDYNDYEE